MSEDVKALLGSWPTVRVVWCSPERVSSVDQVWADRLEHVQTSVGPARVTRGRPGAPEGSAEAMSVYYLKDPALADAEPDELGDTSVYLDDPVGFEEE